MTLSFFVTVLPVQAATPAQTIKTALQRFPGRVIKWEQEHEKGQLVYQITIRQGNGQIQEVELLASSGQVLKTEADDDVFPAVPAGILSVEQVMAQFKGGTLLEVALKPVVGGFQYHLEWRDAQGQKWEQQQDARTGKLIAKQRDH
ncbi:MAG: PepSY domain-containing protein [Candidatus Sericytochromatia bacterium]